MRTKTDLKRVSSWESSDENQTWFKPVSSWESSDENKPVWNQFQVKRVQMRTNLFETGFKLREFRWEQTCLKPVSSWESSDENKPVWNRFQVERVQMRTNLFETSFKLRKFRREQSLFETDFTGRPYISIKTLSVTFKVTLIKSNNNWRLLQ